MKRSMSCLVVAVFMWAFAVAASAQELTYEPVDSGFSLSLTGIEEVIALSGFVTSVASGVALVSQVSVGSSVRVTDVISRTALVNAFQGNQGILMLNQDAGNLNSQANVRVLAFAEGGGMFQDIGAWRQAILYGNTVTTNGGARENRIENSFGATAGVVGVNQSAGNLNLLANILVMGIGLDHDLSLLSLGDSELMAVNANNEIVKEGPDGPRMDILNGPFTGFRGIAQVSQSSGDLNIVGNVLGLSYQVLNVQ